MEKSLKKGFTLVELIVVIGIIVILAAILIASLNPAELIRRSRDTKRINDLNALNRALAYYLADVDNPNLTNDTNQNARCVGGGGTQTAFLSNQSNISISGFATSATNSRNVNGTGWLPVNFSLIAGGAPFGSLPLDPINNNKFFYIYACSVSGGFTYEINARLESLRYISLVSNTNDGGNNDNAYEIGTKLDILPNFTWP